MLRDGRRLIWSDDDVRFVADHYPMMPLEDIGRHLGVSTPCVSAKARELGFITSRKQKKREWSPSELCYLRSHYPVEPAVDISDALGVSVQLVYVKARELGLCKKSSYNPRDYNNRYVGSYKNR